MRAQDSHSTMAGRLLIGCLLLCPLACSLLEASPATPAVQETGSENVDHLLDSASFCTPLGMRDLLGGTRDLSYEDYRLIHESCRNRFLLENEICEEVRQTVDQWLGTDLSKLGFKQSMLLYRMTKFRPKPEGISDGFEEGCSQMVQSFENYRNTIWPLGDYIIINPETRLGTRDSESDDANRDILNYMQYARFCKALIAGGPEEEPQPDQAADRLATSDDT